MKEFDELYNLVKYLRSENGCPWDREQTSESIAFDLVEEAYEVNDSIGKGDVTKLKEELGDLLFLVLMHIRIKEEEGAFTIEEVLRLVRDKMIYRHPHVFGEKEFRNVTELLENWEKSKENPFENLPNFFPALLLAQKLVQKIIRLNSEKKVEEIYASLLPYFADCNDSVKNILKEVVVCTAKNLNLEKLFRERLIKVKEDLSQSYSQ